MIATTMATEFAAEQKRSRPHGFLIGDGNASAAANLGKRLKATNMVGTGANYISSKEKKDGVGERVAALQQLVSPFGKTDTASVLLEATEYIKFLHDQLQVLSTPYLRTMASGEVKDTQYYSLRGRGLCLVPAASAHSIARSNGADIWAPTNASKPNYKLYLAAQTGMRG